MAQQANDAFAAATVITGNSAQLSGSNVGATSEQGEPRHAGAGGGASVWWQWTASASLVTTIDTVGSDFDTVLAVYTGTVVSGLGPVIFNDDALGGLQSRVQFSAIAGTTYRIAVDGFSTSRGTIVLNLLSADPAPVIAASPGSGALLILPDGALGRLSSTTVDFIATGGGGASSTTISCVASPSGTQIAGGLLIGPVGSVPAGATFEQTIRPGEQPVDMVVGAALTTSVNIGPHRVECTVTPLAGSSYAFSYQVQRPAALAANAAPLVSAVPPSGSTLPLQAATVGGLARGVLDLRAVAGLGSGSALVTCSGADGLQLSAVGSSASSAQFSQTVPADGALVDLQIAAAARDVSYTLSLICNVTPSSGSPYGLLFTVSVPAGLAKGALDWQPVGPGPASGGQTEGIVGPPANAVSGAVQVALPHPTNADVLFIGAVNGGVWRTRNAGSASPNWEALTDQETSLSIGALVFDTADASANTLVAGIGRFSAKRQIGGAADGLLRSTDGGSTWRPLSPSMSGKNVTGLAVHGNTIIASADDFALSCADFGLFRSTDGGANFVQLTAAEGFAPGWVTALFRDPAQPQIVFAHLDSDTRCGATPSGGGLYRSADGGASWQRVGSPAMDALFATSRKYVRGQVVGGRIAVGIADARLLSVFHSSDSGVSWVDLGRPKTIEDGDEIGLHVGGSARLFFSLAVDRNNPNLVYVGGDRQPDEFPNSLGANDFSGRLFRGDASVVGSAWVSLTHSGTIDNSAPHADSRSMAVDVAGRLIETDDGGVYARLQPSNTSGGWISLNGDLGVTEQHSVAFDPVSGVVISGNQDNGTMRQTASGSREWALYLDGDGGDLVVDALQSAELGRSVTYSSAQFLSDFSRREYSAANSTLTVDSPELLGTDGSGPPTGQFVTPLSTNQVVGHRLVIGGGSGVYESFDSGDTSTLIAEGLVARQPLSAISLAYGAVGNPDILYIAGCRGTSCIEAGDDGIFVRTTPGTPPQLVRANGAQQVAQAVVVDRENAAHAFAHLIALQGRDILLRTSNTGASWEDITGDLPVSAGPIRSLRHIETPTGDALVVGTNAGVFIAPESQAYRSWTRLGEGLPNAPVSELDYDATRDLLVAGTLGRGAFQLSLPKLKANPGWSGVWFDPTFDGQGFQFDVIADQEALVVGWYTHTPGSLPRNRSNLIWLTGVGALNNGVASVSVISSRGTFGAPTNFTEQAGSVQVRFLSCQRAIVDYDLTVGGSRLQGSIPLQRLTSDAVCDAYRTIGDAAIDTLPAPATADRFQYGITGTWFNPAADGQGMLLEYLPQSEQLLAGWYTYDFTDSSPQGAQPPFWVSAVGPVVGSRATLNITLTRGGGFVSADPVVSTAVGTLTIDVSDCTHVTASYSMTIDGQQRSGQFPMQRLTSATQCKQPVASPND